MALTKSELQLLDITRKVAWGLGKEGRRLTDLIGELSACRYLNLKWKPSDGYDAIAKNGERVQIKSRKSWTTVTVNPSGRLGKFGRKAGYKFDKGVYIELDQHFEVAGIWEMNVDEIQELESKLPGGKPLHVGTFRSQARQLWP